jgi:hypothetical protein
MILMRLSLCLAGLALAGCQMAAPAPVGGLPDGFQWAGYIPEWPEPQYPEGTGPQDVIVRNGCFYLWHEGRVTALPFTERIPATGAISTYDRYCIG